MFSDQILMFKRLKHINEDFVTLNFNLLFGKNRKKSKKHYTPTYQHLSFKFFFLTKMAKFF